jgi:hypothetical protein
VQFIYSTTLWRSSFELLYSDRTETQDVCVFCMIHAWCVDLLRAWLVAFVLGGDAAVDTLVKHAARTVRGKKLLILLEHFLVVVGQGGYFVNFLGGV